MRTDPAGRRGKKGKEPSDSLTLPSGTKTKLSAQTKLCAQTQLALAAGEKESKASSDSLTPPSETKSYSTLRTSHANHTPRHEPSAHVHSVRASDL